MSEKVPAARLTFENMKRILPELQRGEGEGSHDWRIRVEIFFAKRWNCAWRESTKQNRARCVDGSSTIRHFTATGYPPYRAPTVIKNHGFFPDLREYGGARFTKAGELIKSSLGKGPDMEAYMAEYNEYARLRNEAEMKPRKRVA